MRLITFQDKAGSGPRLGALVGSELDLAVDLALSRTLCTSSHQMDTCAKSALLTGDMTLLLAGGDGALDTIADIVKQVENKLDDPLWRHELLSSGHLKRVDTIRFLPTVHRPGKIVCVGLNFQSHIDEALKAGAKLPQTVEVPGAFGKVTSALIGHNGDIAYPAFGTQLDYEVELAMVIGRRCKAIQPNSYKQYVAGLTIGVDLSLRDVLFRSPHPFEAKNYDACCPLGPALVTLDELDDPDELTLRLWVNDELRQEESMGNALFSCGEVLAYWSARMTFEPGDIVLMGTPAGVGIFSDNPSQMLLRPGDRITTAIDGLGELRNRVVTASHE